jgi:hypothetical protein
MKGVFKAMGFAAATLLVTSFGFSDDVASMRAELADMKAQLSAQSAMDSCTTCEMSGPESLTSLKKNAQVQIGGNLNVDLVFAERDTATSGNIRTTHFAIPSDPIHASDSTLDFKINTSDPKSYVFISLDLGEWDASPTAGQSLIDKAYFAWEDVSCTNLDIIFGKADTHYGVDKSPGIMPSLQDGGLYVADGQYDGGTTNSSATQALLPTGATDVYMIGLAYDFDWATFYFDLFQNGTGRDSDGNSQDDLLFESWNTALEFNPSESLMVKVSFQNLHSETANAAVGGREEDQKSISLAANYTTCSWDFWTEYQHGWNVRYDDGADADMFTLGAMYTMNEQWAFYGMAEYGELTDISAMANNNTAATSEDYTQFQLGAIRTLNSGMTLTFEYAHQEVDTNATTGDNKQKADSIGMRAGFSF